MKNINAIRSQLSKSFITISLVFLGLIFLFWLVIFTEYHATQKSLLEEQLESTVTVYKTNLAGKLSIIASSPIFEQYLKSGRDTRTDLYTQFLNEILTIKDSSIIGMEIKYSPSPLMKGIESSQPKLIFKNGDTTSPYYVNLRLCYLNDRLDSENGICQNTWKLYFSKNKFVSSLKSINRGIELCSNGNCNQINAINSKSFGSFPVVSASNLPVSLKIKGRADVLLYLISVMTILLLVSLAFFIRRKTKNIVNSSLADPLNKIIESLKKGELPRTQGYIEELEYLCNQIAEYYKEKDKIEIAKIAGQAAHDIRSPLAALEIATKNLSALPEQEKILIRNATMQIRDIANNLLQQNVTKESINYAEIKSVMLIPIVEYVLSEKIAELSEKNSKIILNHRISKDSFKTFIKVIPLELKRILSNLFNNSIEAIGTGNSGTITISTRCKENQAIIEIKDDGPGVPKHIIDEIFTEGVSSKEKGSGLGLYHAKTNIESWNGNIKISSEGNKSTQVTITIPKQPIANWFAKQLNIPKMATIVIIDDSKSIYNIWQKRLSQDGFSSISLQYFNAPTDFIAWYKTTKAPDNNVIYLVDYEFSGEKLNGIDLIKELNETSQKLLVTSRAEDFNIQSQCSSLNIQLIPKYFVPIIPLQELDNTVDIVLIESEKTLRDAWTFRENKKGRTIAVYSNITDFLAIYRLFSRNTKIYMCDAFFDYIAILQATGFSDINLITHNPEKYKNLKSIHVLRKFES